MESLNPNKHLKEQFVSNLTGSSKLEISLLITNLTILILIGHCIRLNCPTKGVVKKDDNVVVDKKNSKGYIVALFVDYLCIMIPYILFLTVLADWTFEITILLFLALISMIASKRNESSLLQDGEAASVRASISSYRVAVMLVTCISILAVDFNIFPRRYAKTETYGSSLMDLGVGSFVVANSLVSRQARGISNMTLGNVFRSTSPLIILGFVRLISTSSVNYQVHVGEYGVHWNFFFTLAAVAILSAIINVHPSHCGILGSLILIGYQILLLGGLSKYLLSDKRGIDIVSQNKEGIFSILGYWSMYLLGIQLGNYLFFSGNAIEKLKNKKWVTTRIWGLCIFFWVTTLLLDRHVEAISRRTCNLAYVSLVLAFNLQVLAILMLSDYVPGHKSSVLEDSFDKNLLASFLLANVLTGLANLSVDTLSASSISALAVLFAYAFVLSSAVGFVNYLNISLKFW